MKNGIYRHLLVFVLLAGVGSIAFAQSNQRIDELISQDAAQAGHVSYLLMSAAGLVAEDTSPQVALRTASDAGWIEAGTGTADSVTFGQFSHIMMESFNIPGGVMYRILSGPRYAAREVVYQGWSRQRRSTGDRISGEEAVRILSVYLNEQGGVQ